eukprot:m.71207 g.71207  ORF g.71207 m.71207 type:complete len:75 (-) comp8338_c7_seq1:140-364(-)
MVQPLHQSATGMGSWNCHLNIVASLELFLSASVSFFGFSQKEEGEGEGGVATKSKVIRCGLSTKIKTTKTPKQL